VAKVSEKDGGIGGFFRNIPEFVQQVRAETAKVAWPTRRETTMTAVMVVIMTTVLALFFFGVDNAFNGLAQLLLKLVG
jgi:preprotein translocase subunit SecE